MSGVGYKLVDVLYVPVYILDQKVMRDLLAQLREEFIRRLADSCSGANDEREGFAVTTALLPSLTDHLLRACQVLC